MISLKQAGSRGKNYPRLRVMLFLLVCTFLLTACGFALRGYGPSAQKLPFKTIYVSYSDQSEFGLMLRRHLRSYGDITIADSSKNAQVRLIGLSEVRRKEVLSLSSYGRAREYSLFYDIRFRVTDSKNQELIPPTLLSLRRTITYNETEALSKEGEERMLYRDMQSDLVQQIIRQLAALPQPPDNPLPSQNNATTQDAATTGRP